LPIHPKPARVATVLCGKTVFNLSALVTYVEVCPIALYPFSSIYFAHDKAILSRALFNLLYSS
jgi:hypothetical protein